MHILLIVLTVVLGCIAAFWLVQSVRSGIGVMRLPRIERIPPLDAANCPRVSIIFAARDEARKLPAALQTMLSLDYPDYEVIAVDDRSADATGRIMDEFAAKDRRLRVLRINSLPPGWLGKPHALDQGFQFATGSWIVFTDADVHFAPDVLRRVMYLALDHRLDHLTLITRMVMDGFWERVAIPYFGMAFSLGTEVWRTDDPRSSSYTGVGAFQLVRKTAYEKVGGHRRLAMEVVDDMKLGKILKLGGFRSQVGLASQHVSVHWQAGLGNVIRGTTKNFFAVAGFRVWWVAFHVVGLLLASVVPWVALIWLLAKGIHSAAAVFAAVAVGIPLIMHTVIAIRAKISPL
ncbi:MAG TPA: glycosyltransferase family 2 protein, partial [Candidatus Acidoferrum sp.]|nr:glycosyltransferase family 2 protein [Candidatus Acidoferrum sp.]